MSETNICKKIEEYDDFNVFNVFYKDMFKPVDTNTEGLIKHPTGSIMRFILSQLLTNQGYKEYKRLFSTCKDPEKMVAKETLRLLKERQGLTVESKKDYENRIKQEQQDNLNEWAKTQDQSLLEDELIDNKDDSEGERDYEESASENEDYEGGEGEGDFDNYYNIAYQYL